MLYSRVLLEGNEPEKVRLGDYTMTVQFAADRRIDGRLPGPRCGARDCSSC